MRFLETDPELRVGMEWVVDRSATHPTNVLRLLDLDFVAIPGVFSPEFCEGSEFFARLAIGCIGEGGRFLEIGPGVGLAAVGAARRGALVTAIDISTEAVKNTEINALLHDVFDNVSVLRGDIYEPLETDARFDVIFWNAPFGNVPDDGRLTPAARAVFDPAYRSLERFFAGACTHLATGGILALGFSSTLGDVDAVHTLANEAGFRVRQTQSMCYDERRGPGDDTPLTISYDFFEFSRTE